jgi:hypothetical protein
LDGVRGVLRLRDQIEKRKAHDQEDYDPLDPLHVGLFILPVFTADYSNTLPHVQGHSWILTFYPMRPHIGSRHAASGGRTPQPTQFRNFSSSAADEHSVGRGVGIQLTTAHRLCKII